ncbi:MAG: nitroreductase family protein [Bacillota bacterium]
MDFRKLEKFISYKGRKNKANDVEMLFLGIQDVSYAAMNFVMAAEALGLGTCFFGGAPMIEPCSARCLVCPNECILWSAWLSVTRLRKARPGPGYRLPASS